MVENGNFFCVSQLRYEKFSSFLVDLIKSYLWILCKENPTQKLRSYVMKLAQIGIKCSIEYVRQIFKSWGWSWKKPSYKQIQKYTQKNLARYQAYTQWIAAQDLSKLKFMDEVHFVSKNVNQNKGLSPKGQNIILVQKEHFAESYSVSCLCSLTDQDPTYITCRKNSNDQTDFFEFVLNCILHGRLQKGDTLLCDNASVHTGLETLESILLLLELYGISFQLLPSYSPEFNPCELIFADVKHYLRNHRNLALSLASDIALAFAFVTPNKVASYYKKCCTSQ